MTVTARTAPGLRARPLAVAVDVGTTGARAAAYDLSGRLVAEVRRRYPTTSPHPGWAEQDARQWADGAVAALAGLARRIRSRGGVRAIGLTGQCPTVVPVDARCRPVGPGMLYRDNRAVAEAAAMRTRIGAARMHRRTGHVPEAFHVGPKVLWLRAHAPSVFGSTAVFLQPRDVVLQRLTGTVATDETHANATLFFDLRARRWDPRLFEAFDLDPGLFPRVLAPWAVAGGLSRQAAERTGLPRGLPVVIGAADSQCAAFGAGVTGPGPVSEMAGASSCLNSAVAIPLDDPRVTHYSYVVPALFCTELGVNTSGAALTWAVQQLGYPDFASLAGDAARHRRRVLRGPGGAGSGAAADLAPLFLPYLGDGERDDPEARAAFLGMSDRHARGALAFSVVEGVALAVCQVVRALQSGGAPLSELRVGGGGGHLALLGQLKADALGVPVRHLDVDPAGLGAAMLAAAAAGLEEEATASIEAALRRARRFEPTPAGSGFERERIAWFDDARASPATHRPPLRGPAGGSRTASGGRWQG